MNPIHTYQLSAADARFNAALRHASRFMQLTWLMNLRPLWGQNKWIRLYELIRHLEEDARGR